MSAGELLLEEQRTNLITNSDLLDDFSINTGGVSSVVTSTAPDTTTQVYRLLAESSSGRCRCNFSASSSNNIAVSAFLKKDTHRYVQIGFGGNSNNFCALFDLDPGVTNRLLSQDGNGTFTNIDAGYQELPNGWIRAWAVGTTTGSDGIGIGIVKDATKTTFSATNVFNGTESIYIWGAQYEDNASFPTSYIPTQGSTATRAADVSTSAATFGNSWYRQDEGTVFVEGAAIGRAASSPLVQFQDASATDRIQFRQNAPATDLAFQVVDGASGSPGLAATAFQLNAFYKGAIATKTSDHAATINSGTISASSTPSTMPTVDQLRFNTTSPVLSGSYLVRRLTYWPQRLSNDTLQTITV